MEKTWENTNSDLKCIIIIHQIKMTITSLLGYYLSLFFRSFLFLYLLKKKKNLPMSQITGNVFWSPRRLHLISGRTGRHINYHEKAW